MAKKGWEKKTKQQLGSKKVKSAGTGEVNSMETKETRKAE